MPSYITDFKCIGGACEDSCCIGWDIDIDKITYRQYFRTKNEVMKSEFRKHIYKNEACDSEDVDYGRVKIRENTWCPFLNQNKLCDIYIQLGEEMLSNVCTSYPRVLNIVDNRYEMSLFMSCPEAARQLLSDDRPIQWKQETIDLSKYIIHSQVMTKDTQWKSSPIKYLNELQKLSLDYIQDRDYPLEDRLIGLGHRLEAIQAQMSPNQSNKRPLLISEQLLTYSKLSKEIDSLKKTPSRIMPKENDGSIDASLEGSDDKKAQLLSFAFLRELLHEIGSSDHVDSQAFLTSIDKVKQRFHIDETTSLSVQTHKYLVHKQGFEEFLSGKEPILEKYLVNFMFQGSFPFTENDSIVDGYVMLIVRYVFLRFLLLGQMELTQTLERDDIIRYIQVFTKTIEHHRTFITDVLTSVQIKEFDTIEILKHIIRY